MKKVALVTGCNSGLGIAVAERLVKDGYGLIAHYHSDCAAIDRLVADYPVAMIEKVRADLDESGTCKVIDRVNAYQGTVKLLVNNAAAVVKEMAIPHIEWKAVEESLKVNFIAPLALSSAVFDVMTRNGGGKIITVSSVGARYGGGETTIHYGMAKSALDALTKRLSRQGAPYGILVNSVRPGLIDTDFHRKNTPTKDMDKRARMVPLRRMATPGEVAELVMFLVSDKGDYITGEILTIAGGD